MFSLGVIPWYSQFQWPDPPLFGAIAVRGFGLMVVSAILVGYQILLRRSRLWKLKEQDVADFVFYTVFFGFIGSHVVDVVFYHPQKLMKDPWLIFKVWDGISSLGGWISGLLAAYIFFRLKPELGKRKWEFFDCLGFAWPFAWILARGGCALAHDHPGTRSTFWLAVDFPANVLPGGPRHDLGLYEMIYMIIPCVLFVCVRRYEMTRPKLFTPGFYLGLMFVVYAPVRFTLDFLRVNDARYFVDWFPPAGGFWSDPVRPLVYMSSGWIRGLTPAHFMSLGLFCVGLWILFARPGARPEPEGEA